MDPHQRLLLEVQYQALAEAGFDKAALLGSQTGVFVGLFTGSDWGAVRRDAGMEANPYSNLGYDPAAAAGRLSFVLGLKGPCFMLNTACSSGLVALDCAAQSLREGACDQAVVAAVNLQLHPTSWLLCDGHTGHRRKVQNICRIS